MQVRAMLLEPQARSVMGIAAQVGHQRIKGRSVVEMGKMGHLMRDNRQTDMIGCHDQSPIIADAAG